MAEPPGSGAGADASRAAVDAEFRRGEALHRQGRLAEAEAIYDAVLRQQPDHFDALHLLGIVAAQTQRPDRAAELIGRAIAANGSVAAAHSNLGNAFRALGRLAEAVASYDRAIALKPDFAQAQFNRGNALHDLGRFAEAVASYDAAIALRADYAEAFNNRGNALREQGRSAEAIGSYDRAIAIRPSFAEAHFNRGTALEALGRGKEAAASYGTAIAHRPAYPQALGARAAALLAMGQREAALTSYDALIALRPDNASALNNRGNILLELGRPDEALASYDRAVALMPDSAEAQNNRGNALQTFGRLDEAIATYDRAIALRADYAEALNNRGNALQSSGRLDEALASYDRAIVLNPGYAEALSNRGNVLRGLNRLEEGLASHDRAIELDPSDATFHSNRGNVLHELNRIDEAIASFDQAIALKPDDARARFAQVFAELPVLYDTEQEIAPQRRAYEARLKALAALVASSSDPRPFVRGIGAGQPFFLAYQGHNDRDLQAAYGALVCRVMGALYPAAPMPAPPRPDEPVRVGIVSGFFRHHSNWKIPIKGWLTQLDRKRFRLFGYNTGLADAQTEVARSLCERFVTGQRSPAQWRDEILADAPHVLIYPEVGMDSVVPLLAAQRLAPVQCNSWGHPDTSGFPTIDYILSSDLMEPADADGHYTERLVRLPNLSVFLEPVQGVAPPPREAGAPPRFWCGQSLFKYLPQHDAVFARIAREVGPCEFVFIDYDRSPAINAQFRRRLERAFAAVGLNSADHCRFLGRLGQAEFIAAIGRCDVFLDSIDWSGCNSTLESLAHDLPIVTRPGTLMRGRHSAAILTMMGVTETIAASLEDYVAIAVRMARDSAWRQTVKAKVAANKHRLYGDRACIDALEAFLDDVGRRGTGPK